MDRAFERFWRLETRASWLEDEEKKELREGGRRQERVGDCSNDCVLSLFISVEFWPRE